MKSEKSTRDFYFDTLKGFLILSVIIGNSIELASPQNVDTHYFLLFLYMFHMPMFTFVSGYFSKLSKRTTVQKVTSTFKLYFFAQLFYIIFYKYILRSSGYKFEFMYPQWTLWYLLSLTCWYILGDYIKDKKKWLIGAIIVSLIAGFDNSIGSLGSMERTLFYFPFFIAGMAFDKKYIEVLKRHRIKLLISSAIVLILLYVFSKDIKLEFLFELFSYSAANEDVLLPPFLTRIFHYGGAFVIGTFILTLVPNFKTILSPLGKNSLILYLSHAAVCNILIGVGIARYNNLIELILSEIIIVCATIIITDVFLKLKEKIINKKSSII